MHVPVVSFTIHQPNEANGSRLKIFIFHVFLAFLDDQPIKNKTLGKAINWWEDDYKSDSSQISLEKDEDKISEDIMKSRYFIDMIKSHEKSRLTFYSKL